MAILAFRVNHQGRKSGVEALWRDFFSHTSQWCDHRPEKINPRFPDFKHKHTGESLWLADVRNPPWVHAELASIPPGALQSNVFAWAQRLKRYVKAGQFIKTLEVFNEMQQERICPNTWTFLPVLNACAGLGALEDGKRIHTQIIDKRCETNLYVANGLVDMYAKCGSIKDAWSVFIQMREHDVVSWNVIIGGYVKSGQGLKAMELFREMKLEGVEPDSITFVGVLNACASVAALDEGRRIHENIIQRGWESDVYVGNSLVDMYAKCGSMDEAWSVFKVMREQNVVSWNAMIGGYVKSGKGLKAIELFLEMQQEGLEPSTVTFVAVLNACASVAALQEGRRVHDQIIRRGCLYDVYVATCLVDMYAKCGSMEDAWSVFNKMQGHTVVSWNAMIVGYVKSGQGLKAVELFKKMQQEQVEPDNVTFVEVLNACASVAALEEGRNLHENIIQKGCESDIYVANCLVDMYAKCGSIEDAWSVFKKMQRHDVVSWTAMIGGCVKSGQGLKAVELFQKMQQEGVEPNTITFVEMLNACSSLAALEEGGRVHEQIMQRGPQFDVYVANCLVDMYAKCGSIEDARGVFDKMQEHTVVSWTAMMGGYAMHGLAGKAIGLFKRMRKEDVEINGITFTCLLSACNHGGLVKEGLRYFKSMISCYSVDPTMEHYSCIVDLLGRAGRLVEAEEMAKRMPMERNASAWMSLLGACRNYGNIEMAERAAQHCQKLDPKNASGHVLLSNIYSAAGKWERSAAIQEEMLEGNVGRGEYLMHSSVINEKIYPELERLPLWRNKVGDIPDTMFV